MSNDISKNNRVGPIIRSGDVAQAVAEAVTIDNPGKEIFIDDKVAYVRIAVESECILHKETMEEVLGREFEMRELEINLSSFAGQIETTPEYVRFYYDKTL